MLFVPLTDTKGSIKVEWGSGWVGGWVGGGVSTPAHNQAQIADILLQSDIPLHYLITCTAELVREVDDLSE